MKKVFAILTLLCTALIASPVNMVSDSNCMKDIKNIEVKAIITTEYFSAKQEEKLIYDLKKVISDFCMKKIGKAELKMEHEKEDAYLEFRVHAMDQGDQVCYHAALSLIQDVVCLKNTMTVKAVTWRVAKAEFQPSIRAFFRLKKLLTKMMDRFELEWTKVQ